MTTEDNRPGAEAILPQRLRGLLNEIDDLGERQVREDLLLHALMLMSDAADKGASDQVAKASQYLIDEERRLIDELVQRRRRPEEARRQHIRVVGR